VSFFSGIVDEHDRLYPGAHPGALRELLGITIEEFHPLREGEEVSLSNGGRADVWSERIQPMGAQAHAYFTDGPDAGQPAITRNTYGAGCAWYVGTRLDVAALGAVVRDVLRDAAVRVDSDRPAEVETVRRSGPNGSFLFVINHDLETEATVRVSGTDLLTGRRSAEKVVVPAAGVAVIREEAGS
jgi:beta-galactosidase